MKKKILAILVLVLLISSINIKISNAASVKLSNVILSNGTLAASTENNILYNDYAVV